MNLLEMFREHVKINLVSKKKKFYVMLNVSMPTGIIAENGLVPLDVDVAIAH